jgi:hypothetical protein
MRRQIGNDVGGGPRRAEAAPALRAHSRSHRVRRYFEGLRMYFSWPALISDLVRKLS